MIENRVNQQSSILQQSLFLRKQFPEILTSGLGTTKVFVYGTIISHHKAIQHQKIFIHEQYPEPLPSRIGEEDLPGGFKKENVSGQSQALYNLARGIVQSDKVKVIFDAKA
ncbi:MAG TPA: hypothetical protein VMZ04_03085, partial [Anaerolineae bacterium]|nr:hypothetical protein [Anaerolineae bacterium]